MSLGDVSNLCANATRRACVELRRTLAQVVPDHDIEKPMSEPSSGETSARAGSSTRARGAMRVEPFWHDVRYAARGVRRKPAFSAAVVLTLGLGIGANATMFGIVDRLLFRPPAYTQTPERVHRVNLAVATERDGEFITGTMSYK